MVPGRTPESVGQTRAPPGPEPRAWRAGQTRRAVAPAPAGVRASGGPPSVPVCARAASNATTARELLGRGLAPHQPQDRRGVGRAVGVLAHSGMFPCFFGGRVSRLVRSRPQRLGDLDAGSCGGMTAST